MERSARTQRTLSKQAEFDEDSEVDSALSNRSMESEVTNEEVPLPPVPINNNTVHRVRSQSKVKLLVRSHAVREETSPPPDPPASPELESVSAPTSPTNNNNNSAMNSNNNNNHISNITVSNGTNLSVTGTRHKLRREGSSQGSMDSSWSGCLSRGSSMEQQYTDGTGIDLEQFIHDTLNRNQKDRMLLLKIEHELISLVRDAKRSVHKFPPMSSYQRMLVHRAAAYFGMDHNVDTSGHQVVVNRTKATRVPDSRFRDHVRDDILFPEEPRRSILKRDSSSFEESCCFKSPDRQLSNECRRSKSFEEREEEYEKARRRIFNSRDSEGYEHCSRHNSQDEDDLRWSVDVQPWMCTDSENPTDTHLKSQSHCHERPNRLIKVASYESKDTLRANSLRQSVSKSYSFGGYDQQNVPNIAVLTKQDSGSSMSSRLSPSSSGYKSQSQQSDTTISATPSPIATPNLATQLSSQSSALSPEPESVPTVVWAVTSIAAVPPGSVLINPQTGQPYTNSDGSIYHFDPENPPKMESTSEIQPIPQPSAVKSDENETDNERLCNGELSEEAEDKSSDESPPPQTAATTTSITTTVTTVTSTSVISTSTTNTTSVTHTSNHVIPASQKSLPHTATCCSQNNVPDTVQSHTGPISLHPPQSAAHAPPQPILYPVSPHPPMPPTQYPAPNPSYPQPTLCPYTPGSYNFVLQPPAQPPPPPHPPQLPPPQIPIPGGESVFPPAAPVNGTVHPLVYASVPPANHGYTPIPNGSVQPPYEQRLPISDGGGPAHELNNYMMGLNLGDNSRQGMTSTAVYWPPVTAPIPPAHPAHISQGQNQSVPIYYAPPQPPGHNAAPRYQYPGCSTYSALPSIDRLGSGYGGSDCSLNYPQPMPMYYNPHCNNNQNTIPPGPNGYCGAGGGVNNGVVMQFPPNTIHGARHPSQPCHKTSTPPNTPQGLCPQYTVFNNGYGLGGIPGCYPSHYPSSANPSSHHQLPMPPTLRPPNLNLPMAVRSSPPLRSRGPSYNGTRSPPLKDRSPAIYPIESSKPPHAAGSIRFTAPTHAHMPPFYGIPVMPGDVRLMGNSNRLPLPSSNSNKPITSHTRKQRAKPSAVVASRNGARPIVSFLSQQQPQSFGIPPCYMVAP